MSLVAAVAAAAAVAGGIVPEGRRAATGGRPAAARPAARPAAARPGRHGKGGRATFPRTVIDYSRGTPEGFDYRLFETAPGKVSWYSSLLPWHIEDASAALRAEFPGEPPRLVVDATAHVGADAVNFLKVFPTASVHAVELDPGVADILRRNGERAVRALGLRPDQFRAEQGDGAEKAFEYADRAGLLFFDPPWNGAPHEPIRLGKWALSELVAEVLRRVGREARVVVKLPKGADLDEFDMRVGRTGTRYPVKDARRPEVPSYWLLAYRPV